MSMLSLSKAHPALNAVKTSLLYHAIATFPYPCPNAISSYLHNHTLSLWDLLATPQDKVFRLVLLVVIVMLLFLFAVTSALL